MGRPRKPIYGIGINDAPYNTEWFEVVSDGEGADRKVTRICPYYSTYKAMFTRAYSKVFHEKCPSYKECSVHPKWHSFMAFKSWMEKQDWNGKQLDKDLLLPRNKTYGPDTCCFIDKKINIFIQHMYSNNPESLYGVCYTRYTSRPKCQFAGKHVGYFDSPHEAHEMWRTLKHDQACKLAEKQTDERIAEALRSRYANHSICCGIEA